MYLIIKKCNFLNFQLPDFESDTMKVPEKFRVLSGSMASDESWENNGYFKIPLKYLVMAHVIVSDGLGWEHVSVHITEKNKNRTPTWDEMCKIKNLFWDETDCVIQYHPPKSEYVNNHPHCLHLWKPIGVEIPLPPSILVGVK